VEINWTTVVTTAVAAAFTLAAVVVGSRLRLREARSIRMQEKQAELIGELYGLLMDVRDAVEPVLDPALHSQEQSKGLGTAWMAFDGFFRKRQIYFDADVCKEIKALWPLVGKAAGNAKIWHEEEMPAEARIKAAQANNGAIREKIDAIVARLEQRFRQLR